MSDSEFMRRFKLAEEAKAAVLPEIREVYHFCLDGQPEDPGSARRDEDVFSSAPAEAAEDFASDLTNYFMPEHAPWIRFEAGSDIIEEYEEEVNAEVASRQKTLMSTIASANLYAVIGQVFLDASHGTIAMWIHDAGPSQTPVCEPVHVSEVFINVGTYGLLDDRFRKRNLSWAYVAREYPQAKRLKAYTKAAQSKPEETFVDVIEGFWRDWSDDSKGEEWHSYVYVAGEKVQHKKLKDSSEVPLCIGRFRPSTKLPWGRGPGRRLLPEFRVHNEISDLALLNIDRQINPPMWTNDTSGALDLSDGIAGGQIYTLLGGSVLEKVDMGGSIDASMFALDSYEVKVRRGFYQDGPRQVGKTPPTATQWLDEVRRIQQRMGRPAAPIYDEFVIHVVKRFYGLLVKHGKIGNDAKIDGKLIAVKPINPLTFAQRQDEVMTARALLSDMAGFDPAGFPVTVDSPKTFKNFQQTLGDSLVAIRSSDEIEALRQQQAMQLAAMEEGL